MNPMIAGAKNEGTVHRALRLAALLISLVAIASPWRAAGAQDAGTVVALRGFFVAVAAKDYAAAWAAFSAKTQNWVAEQVAGDAHMGVPEVRKLLDDDDDRVQRGFWESFRNASKPEVFTQLPMSPATAPGADGAVNVKLANGKEATFLMYKEGDRWKVGWMETFFPAGKLPANK